MRSQFIQVIVTSIVLVVIGCDTGKEQTAKTAYIGVDPNEVEAEIRELDQIQGKAWLERDTIALKRLWSPDFILQAPSNKILTREEVFREMQTPRLAGGLSSMERSVLKITQFDNIVVSMGIDRPVDKTGSNAGIVRTQRYTNIWRREGDTWRVIARHANLLPIDTNP